jgi:heterodisulfide reductase subunit A-like polyferredoxin
MIPLIDEGLCTGCKKCVEACPPRAIEMKGKKAFIEEEYCEECGCCVPECPVDAISIAFPRHGD